jgi:hypothetical protein
MSKEDYERGLNSQQPKENFKSGSYEWQGANDAEKARRPWQAWAPVATIPVTTTTGSSGPGGIVALEGGILSCVALYSNWAQYHSLGINGLWEYGVAAGLVLLSMGLYLWFCIASKLFTWGSFIIIGALLAAWSLRWGLNLNWRTCLAGFLVVVMFLDRRALRS